MSAARPAYGVPDATVENDQPRLVSTALPLLLLVIGLAAASVWYVALPAFEPEPAKRSCEVIVLESGSTKCVSRPIRTSQVARTP